VLFLQVIRECTETCGHKEKHNECVSVVGHSTRDETIEVRKWGKRQAATRSMRKQHVDVWFGFSPVGEKPGTRYHITMQEDIDNFLKTGCVLHGEWFYHCKRLPGGDHSKPLPDGFGEWEKGAAELAAHVLADFGVELEITDGCKGQYDGHKNHHQTAVWLSKRGICKQHVKNITQHGKCCCDGASCVPKQAVAAAMRDPDTVLLSGTRELVLYLAKAREEPATPGDQKTGWWAFDCYFWGFYDPGVFAGVDVPEAKPLANGSKLHDHIGLNSNDSDGLLGSLYARYTFCACDNCLDRKFSDCLVLAKFGTVTDMIGPMELHHCPRIQPTRVISSADRQKELGAFAKSLIVGRVAVMRVEPETRRDGGSAVPSDTDEGFALICINEAAQKAKKNKLYAGQPVSTGWWIVATTFFECIDAKRHVYKKCSPRPHYVVVTALVRIAHIEFERTVGDRCFMSADTHAQILAGL
jgi:hypothetical protein